eukprot:CAMPEP_0181099934 /NCGR_PEP_ID=MMETSP1071-20121207/12922_1 /TAXON_ID=35127 /ORGANISM="Thalassiosira sp., Strain NH16" /LENGTH=1140 /DNA_ID=CAMNT_0023182625 /DNA_START=379 /DNA_END=3801 /DNA_ORIENTATION=+
MNRSRKKGGGGGASFGGKSTKSESAAASGKPSVPAAKDNDNNKQPLANTAESSVAKKKPTTPRGRPPQLQQPLEQQRPKEPIAITTDKRRRYIPLHQRFVAELHKPKNERRKNKQDDEVPFPESAVDISYEVITMGRSHSSADDSDSDGSFVEVVNLDRSSRTQASTSSKAKKKQRRLNERKQQLKNAVVTGLVSKRKKGDAAKQQLVSDDAKKSGCPRTTSAGMEIISKIDDDAATNKDADDASDPSFGTKEKDDPSFDTSKTHDNDLVAEGPLPFSEAACLFFSCSGCFVPEESPTANSKPASAPGDLKSRSRGGGYVLNQDDRAAVLHTARSWPLMTSEVHHAIDATTAAAATSASLMEAVEVMKPTMDSAETRLSTRADELRRTEADLDKESEENVALREEVAKLKEEVASTNAERGRMGDELEKERKLATDAKEDLEKGQKERDLATRKTDALEAKLKWEIQQNRKLNEEIARLKEDIAASHAKQAEMERVKTRAVEVARRVKDQEAMHINARSDELDRRKVEGELDSVQIAGLRSQIIQLKQIIADSREARTDMDARVIHLETELEEERRSASKTEASLEETRARLDNVQRLLEQRAVELDDIRASQRRNTPEGREAAAQGQVKTQDVGLTSLKDDDVFNETITADASVTTNQSMQSSKEVQANIQEDALEMASRVAYDAQKSGLDCGSQHSRGSAHRQSRQRSIPASENDGDDQKTVETSNEEMERMEQVIEGLEADHEEIELRYQAQQGRGKSGMGDDDAIHNTKGLLSDEEFGASQAEDNDGTIIIMSTSSSTEAEVEVELEGPLLPPTTQDLDEKSIVMVPGSRLDTVTESIAESDCSSVAESSISITSIKVRSKRGRWFRKLIAGGGAADDDETLSTMDDRSVSTLGGISTFDDASTYSRRSRSMRSMLRSKKWTPKNGSFATIESCDISEHTGENRDDDDASNTRLEDDDTFRLFVSKKQIPKMASGMSELRGVFEDASCSSIFEHDAVINSSHSNSIDNADDAFLDSAVDDLQQIHSTGAETTEPHGSESSDSIGLADCAWTIALDVDESPQASESDSIQSARTRESAVTEADGVCDESLKARVSSGVVNSPSYMPSVGNTTEDGWFRRKASYRLGRINSKLGVLVQ